MTKWPAHLAERAAIFELQATNGEPLKGPTRTLLIWEQETYIELDPATWKVLAVGHAKPTKEVLEPQE
jgi:hypothetical protein